MLQGVRVINDFDLDRLFTLSEVSDGIRVTNITGLGPVKADFLTSGKVNGDGVHYNGRKVGSRNIVFSLGMTENETKTIEQIRRDIYDCFPIGSTASLQFQFDVNMREIRGRVESVEPEIFVQEPSIQVSLICVDPYFYAFPTHEFTNGDSVAIPTDTLYTFVDIDYLGTIDTGVTIDMVVTDGDVSPENGIITISQGEPGFDPTLTVNSQGFRIDDVDIDDITGDRVQPGDILNISTIPGKKSATLTRGDEVFNILGAIKGADGIYLKAEQWPLLVGRSVGETRINFWSSNFSPEYPQSRFEVSVGWNTMVEGI